MKGTWLALPIALVLFGYSYPVAENLKTAPNAESTSASKVSESDIDSALAEKIRRELMKDNDLSTATKNNVTVQASSGKVTLQGKVKNQKEKTKISQTARRAHGVKNVDDRLEIVP